ncbi:pyrroloquinoline quinone biosynthesis peptide chaperone PqqD [Elioraea thermophila]|uniref:pyrroloquinoline quinone biosynthesis peptide chaperone PqqD n=1 Tax=Elioraea thermophila TaxID=2185104 RepID=UPI0013008969|nr:pyrroloquinoline quinone biosynthesis peptide chaperone PqqD [Elioraea thermophila]
MAPDAKPQLVPHARLRPDRLTGETLLLYSEAGLKLNPTAAATLALCEGTRTFAEITQLLARRYGCDAAAVAAAADIGSFLDRLLARGLIGAK